MAPIRTTQADLAARRSPTLAHAPPAGSIWTVGGTPIALPGTGGKRSAAAPYAVAPPPAERTSPTLAAASASVSAARAHAHRSPTRSASGSGGSLSSSPTSGSTVGTSVLSASPSGASELARAQAELEAMQHPRGTARARASVFLPRRRGSRSPKSPHRMTVAELQKAVQHREATLSSSAATLSPACRGQIEAALTALKQTLDERTALARLEESMDHVALDPQKRSEHALLAQLDTLSLQPPDPDEGAALHPGPSHRPVTMQFLPEHEAAAAQLQRQVRDAEREEADFSPFGPASATASDDEGATPRAHGLFACP